MTIFEDQRCQVCAQPFDSEGAIGLYEGAPVHVACADALPSPRDGSGAVRPGTVRLVLSRNITGEQFHHLRSLFALVRWIEIVPDRRQGERRKGERRLNPAHQGPGRRRAERRTNQDVSKGLRSQGWAIAWLRPRAATVGASAPGESPSLVS